MFRLADTVIIFHRFSRKLLLAFILFLLAKSAFGQSFFGKHCNRAIENLFCSQEQYNPNGSCVPLAKEFDWVVDEFDQTIAQSPQFIQDLSCQLASIRIVSDKQELEHFAAAYSFGTIIIFAETLENIKGDITHSAPATFKYIFENENFAATNGNVPLSLRFDRKVDIQTFRFRQLFFHEFGHFVDKTFLTFGDTHCVKRAPGFGETLFELGFQETNDPDAYCDYQIVAPHSSDIITQMENSGISSPYGACKPSEDFAERFSHFALHEAFDHDFQIYDGDKLLFSQKRFLERPRTARQINFLRTLFSIDVSTPQLRNKLMLDHMTCSGPFEQN